MVRAAKELREIRTNDPELKAISAIQKALGSLDSQAASRVLTFCIDRARQDYERVRLPVGGPDPYFTPFPEPTEAVAAT